MINIVAVKTAVNNGSLVVKVYNSSILLGYPKADEWVKIGTVEVRTK